MKAILAIIFILLMSVQLSAQNPYPYLDGQMPDINRARTSLQTLNLKGRPEWVKEKRSLIDSIPGQPYIPVAQHYWFDRHGNIIRAEDYWDTIFVKNGGCSGALTYDSLDRLRDVITYSLDSGIRQIEYQYTYGWNSRIKQVRILEHETTMVDDYDSPGRHISQQPLGNDSIEASWRTVYLNDNTGHVKQAMRIYISHGYSDTTFTTVTYDKRGNCTYSNKEGIMTYDKKGKTVEYWYFDMGVKIKYKYDKYGNSIEEALYDSAGTSHGICNFKYIYDQSGNWTEKTLLIDSKPFWTLRREIRYYP